MKELLRGAFPPDDVELKRDLWPEMRERIDQRTLRISAFDWALIAAVLASAVFFPQAMLAIVYHL
jgi:hypothetical protein